MSGLVDRQHWRRWLDGGHTWGSLDVSLSRYGVTRYRLVVFPPGILAEDRMLLRAWRTWPAWGVAAFLILEILLVPSMSPGAALATSTGVLLGSGAVLMAMTATFRAGVRTLTVTRMAGARERDEAERLVRLQALTRELAFADRRLADGEISTVEHEAVVWDVYDRLAEDSRANT
jgi:uncharacterized protein DUF6611